MFADGPWKLHIMASTDSQISKQLSCLLPFQVIQSFPDHITQKVFFTKLPSI